MLLQACFEGQLFLNPNLSHPPCMALFQKCYTCSQFRMNWIPWNLWIPKNSMESVNPRSSWTPCGFHGFHGLHGFKWNPWIPLPRMFFGSLARYGVH